MPLKEAARPSVATSFLIPDLANEKGEQETFHTEENFFEFKHIITALFSIEAMLNKLSRYLC